MAKKVPGKNLHYQNITISGLICTGTSTLAAFLKEKLGWEHKNLGQLTREFAAQNNIPLELAASQSDEFERKKDLYLCKSSLECGKEQIIEGWLSGFMAENIKDVLKVLLVCSDESVRIDRLVNRENITVEEAKNQIKTREKESLQKWSSLYQTADFWNPKFYDIVIDTYSHSREETLDAVLRKLGYFDWLESQVKHD